MYEKKTGELFSCLDYILLDILCLEGSFVLAYLLRHGTGPFHSYEYRILGLWFALLDFLFFAVLRTLQNVNLRGSFEELKATALHTTFLFLSVFTFLFITKSGSNYSRVVIMATVLFYPVITIPVRILYKRFKRHNLKVRVRSLLIISDKLDKKSLGRVLSNLDPVGYTVCGLIFRDPQYVGMVLNGFPVQASFETAVDYVTSHWVDEVVFANIDHDNIPQELIDELTDAGVTVHVSIGTLGDLSSKTRTISKIGMMPVMSFSLNTMTSFQAACKRMVDILGGLAGCLLTGILFLVLAPLIRIQSPGPVFFVQTRVGRNGKYFKLYKFRSMHMDAEERKKEYLTQNRSADGFMFKMDFDPRVIGNRIDEKGNRVTGIGAFIRKHSLDEFPQFFNCLIGDMSLVGTRPPTVDEYENYQAYHKARLSMRPGITGLWQVSGRNNIMDFDEVVRLDTEYVNTWSFRQDLKIILKTVLVVFKGDGAM